MITLILAHDEAGGIGFKSGLPWPRIPEDMKRFRDATLHHTIVMGRKTFETFEKPLPKRENVVVSRNNLPHDGDFIVTNNLLEVLGWYGNAEVFVIGGAEIYEQCLPYATRILLTRVIGTFEADTFWKPNLTGWNLVTTEHVYHNDQRVCVFEEYLRPQPDKLPVP